MTKKAPTKRSGPLPGMAAVALCLLLLGGCASSRPSKFYILHSLAQGGSERPVAALGSDTVIGVGPITIPAYLDRREIMTRTSPTQLDLAEFDRWAESLESNVTRVLADNLSFLLGTDRVSLFPWPGSTRVSYQVTVDFSRFEGDSGGEATLIAHWSILDGEQRETLMAMKTRYTEKADGPGVESMASAQSRLLGRLATDIAREISTLVKE